MEIIIEDVILLEVNYQVEWQQQLHSDSDVIQFLLLGYNTDSNMQYHMRKCCLIPKTLNKLEERVKLLQEVDNSLVPCAILQVSHSGVLQENVMFLEVCNKILKDPICITYQPSKEGKLKLQVQLNGKTVLYRINSIGIRSIEREGDTNNDTIHELLFRVDHILQYLARNDSNDYILRKLQILICSLQRDETQDINDLIQREEMELISLRTVINQWEILNDQN